MKAVFLNGRGGVEVRDVDTPSIGYGEVLVKMTVCGVCGTDLEKIRGHGVTTAILGHEVVGVVEEIGEGVEEVREGDRVFVHHHVTCGKCYYCLNGNPTMCSLFLRTNIEPCGFAEYFKAPRVNVERGAILRLPDNISFKDASFIEPLACCIRSLARAGHQAGQSYAVIGFGPIGALYTLLLKTSGASFIAVGDISENRLKFAEKIGVDAVVNLRKERMYDVCKEATEGRGVDVVVVATGSIKAYEEAFKLVRRGGRICVFGAPARGERLSIDFSRLFIDEITIIPSYSTTERETKIALDMIAMGRIKPGILVSHEYKLEEAVEAFRTASNPEASMKVLIRG